MPVVKSLVIGGEVKGRFIRHLRKLKLKVEQSGLVGGLEIYMAIAKTTATVKIERTLYEPTFYKVIQGGMCFCRGTKVLMANGRYKNIENVREGDEVLSRGVDGSIITTKVKRSWYSGDQKPILAIKINGEEIKATYDHKFYTPRGYIELYKIAWRKMEKSQRVQLKLLCEQYGQNIHLDPIWSEKKAGNNEAMRLYRQKKKKQKGILQNAHGWEKCSNPSCGCQHMDTKPKKQNTSEPYKWSYNRQQSRESGVGYAIRKSVSRIQNRITIQKTRRREYTLKNDTSECFRIKTPMGYWRRKTTEERVCDKVWCFRGNDKRHSGKQILEAFTIDEIQVEKPQKVYSLEIDHPSHNYFVGKSNINVSNSSSKTFSILILLIGYAESYPNSLITVAGMTYNHLATGAMRDFKNIMRETNRWEDTNFNKSAKIYTFRNGSQIEFLSLDSMTSRGPRRDVLFVNEANGITYETFDQLAGRTRDFVILDYNPSSRFWAHDELVEKQKDRTSFIILTYEDNEALGSQERENIESRKPKPGEEPSNYWIVYGLGQIGSLEGNVFEGWCETSPEEIIKNGKLVRYGLDFGFSNDETALLSAYDMGDNKLGLIELIYEKGILGSQYPDKLRKAGVDPNVLIVGDSARPEIIAEIKQAGFRIVGADKVAGSVLKSIDYLKQYQVFYHGKNLKREYLSYAWRKKRTGEIIDEPQDGFDHCVDSARYIALDLKKKRIQF